MSHPNPDDKTQLKSAQRKARAGDSVLQPGVSKIDAKASAPAKALTAEEQMALYEKDLKENDWGHQPC